MPDDLLDIQEPSAPAVRQQSQVAPAGPGSAAALMDVISRAASDPTVDVDKLERLMAMAERMEDRRAVQAYNDAMAAAQAEMPAVFKNAKGQNSRYATLEAVSAKMKPVIDKHGFSLSFGTADGAPANHYRVTCRIAHKDGHSEEAHADVPADGTGAKGGNSSMNVVQAFGSTMTYARRYLTLLIFNVATTDQQDDDGASGGAKISDDQLNEIADLIKETKTNTTKFLEYLKVPSLPDIPATMFNRAKMTLESRRSKNAGS